MQKRKAIMRHPCTWGLLILCQAHLINATDFAGGTGRPDDPYQIRTAEQLLSIGSDPNLLDKAFILLNELDLDPNLPGGRVFSRAVVAPDTDDAKDFFQGTAFTGRFDGDGHTIRNLTIHGGPRAFLGLFGSIGRGGQVRDLAVRDALVSGTGSCKCLGVLAGYAEQCTIVNCSVTGRVAADMSARSLGGLVGYVWFDARIIRCAASCDISAGDVSKSLGGIAGDNGGEIIHCYAAGTISSGYSSAHVGGLVGLNSPEFLEYKGVGSPGYVFQCYSVARVFGGPMSIGVGGLVGQEDDHYLRTAGSFWDITASGVSSSASGTGLTTAQMQDPNTYVSAGWDFAGERANGTADLWLIPKAGEYPLLTTLSDVSPTHTLAGEGTTEDPYRIATAEDLGAVCHYGESASYRLMNDIDLSGIRWSVAPVSLFDGRFDGAGFAISNLNVHGLSCLGLFDGLGSCASVIDLRIVDVNVAGDRRSENVGALSGRNEGRVANCQANGSVAGGDYAGGLVGFNGQKGVIADSYAIGDVSGIGGGLDTAGGLVGFNEGTITNSHASVELSGGQYYTLGGLVGDSYGSILGCHASGQIIGNDPLGGLVGWNDGTVSNCYAAVDVHSREKASLGLGGLVGINRGTVVNSYSVSTVLNVSNEPPFGCGLAGMGWQFPPTGTVVNSFWDMQATGISYSEGGGTGLTTAEMQTAATFVNADWDLEKVWMICERQGYPRLQWENVRCDNH